MARVDEINTDAWLAMLTNVWDASAGYFGSVAITALVAQAANDAKRIVDTLPDVFDVQMRVKPLRTDLALLLPRVQSYVDALAPFAATPYSTDATTVAEQVRSALLTGQQPPPYPALVMPDASLAANVWNRATAQAVRNAEENAAIPLPFGDTDAGNYARERLRHWLGTTENALDDAADAGAEGIAKVKGAIATARDDISGLLAAAQEQAWSLLKYGAVAAGVVLMLWWLLTRRSE